MTRIAAFILRHRRMLLIALMTVTLLVSSEANRRRLQDADATTALPVSSLQRATAVESYILDRDAVHDRDVAALTALISEEAVDDRTREDAARELQSLVRNRECQEALEQALASTALAPCAAVVTGSSVTLVTAKADITDEDAALVLALAAAHASARPQDVRILTVP